MSKFKNKEKKTLNKLGNHANNIYKKLKCSPKFYVHLFAQQKKKDLKILKNDFDIIRHPYAVKYPKTTFYIN